MEKKEMKTKNISSRFIRNSVLYSAGLFLCFINISKLYPVAFIFLVLIVCNILLAIRHKGEKRISLIKTITQNMHKASRQQKREEEIQRKRQYQEFLARVDQDFDFDYSEDDELNEEVNCDE